MCVVCVTVKEQKKERPPWSLSRISKTYTRGTECNNFVDVNVSSASTNLVVGNCLNGQNPMMVNMFKHMFRVTKTPLDGIFEIVI